MTETTEKTPTAAKPAPADPSPPPHKLTRGRKIAVWALILVASVIGLISVLTLWVNRQMLNNDSFTKASAQLVRDPQIRDALSIYLVNQLYNNVDVSQQLENQLPKNLKPLAGPVAAGLRQPATDAVSFLLSLYLQYIKGLSPQNAGFVLGHARRQGRLEAVVNNLLCGGDFRRLFSR